ncbi:MFS transporter [Palleronia abyssalis]|uniref:Major facilitator superfamily (MFS) profile domain-containing protein n=1 Tax=Palleronia abyssalis TaxID=1501240 RepID=A0A2R8BTB7_9RHOB|nr:MFS transporter [Palleronia abyssalis]SPJ23427.1 hypothetical protein PAA8504_01238 [Palleronia abyssalis]
MAEKVARKRIWGWYFFDWASQPYNTLLITFIFGPYVASVLEDGSQAQAAWGYGIAAAGIVMAILAPVLGAIADQGGRRMPWIWGFSALYVIGSGALWFAAPQDFALIRTLFFFGIGLIGMEFATIFTNSMLPDLATRGTIGRISGSGWAFGYLGGLIALVMMLLLFAEDEATGTTLIGLQPLFGLDAEAREGTRFVGPFTAIWYALFMIPFFLWVKEPRTTTRRVDIRGALRDLGRTIRRLPETPSQLTFLISSMLYRDGLSGAYALGAIFAAGVLDWSVVQTGTFGILAVVTGALFAWIGGRADERFGPMPVIVICTTTLMLTVIATIFVSRETVFGLPQAPDSSLPDTVFMVIGATIGAAGGALQSASRTMMVRQGNRARMTEAFGLYALSGKATSFLAPLSIGVATSLTGSQQWGISPLIVLFAVGLILLAWVNPEGDPVV